METFTVLWKISIEAENAEEARALHSDILADAANADPEIVRVDVWGDGPQRVPGTG